MQLRSALLAATVLATPIAASAQPVTGLYVGAGAGMNIMSQEKIKNQLRTRCSVDFRHRQT